MNELYMLHYNIALFKKILEVIANSSDASDLSAVKKLAKIALADEIVGMPAPLSIPRDSNHE